MNASSCEAVPFKNHNSECPQRPHDWERVAQLERADRAHVGLVLGGVDMDQSPTRSRRRSVSLLEGFGRAKPLVKGTR